MICTDIDGTMLDGDAPDFCGLRKFATCLTRCRSEYGAKWVIVTGRQRRAMMPALDVFLAVNLFPDYLVVEDALIHQISRRRIKPFFFWNLKIKWRRSHLWRRSKPLLIAWQWSLLDRFPNARQRSHNMVDLWFEFDSENEAVKAESVLRQMTGEHDEFQVLRWGEELFLAPAAGRKIDAIKKIAGIEKIALKDVFAVGDGANDVNMIEERKLGFRACVGNAPEEIKHLTMKHSGHVSQGTVVQGVLEALCQACPELLQNA